MSNRISILGITHLKSFLSPSGVLSSTSVTSLRLWTQTAQKILLLPLSAKLISHQLNAMSYLMTIKRFLADWTTTETTRSWIFPVTFSHLTRKRAVFNLPTPRRALPALSIIHNQFWSTSIWFAILVLKLLLYLNLSLITNARENYQSVLKRPAMTSASTP